MTTPRRDTASQDGFRAWLQRNPRLESRKYGIVCTDSDMWIRRVKQTSDRIGDREVQHLMLIEYKRFGAQLKAWQRDVLHIINQLLRNNRSRRFMAISQNPRIARCHSLRLDATVAVKCWGVHILRMAGESPDASEWLEWDNKWNVDLEQLEQLLRFELNPDTLDRLADARHHVRGHDGYAARPKQRPRLLFDA